MKNRAYHNIIFILAIMVILVALLVMLKPLEKIKIEEKWKSAKIHNLNAVNTATWDTNKVTIATDTAGISVPVPKGYVASSVDGEHTVKTGFVIYEGTTSVTNSNQLAQAKSRNQWVWVPISDVSRIFTQDSNGVKKARLWDYPSTTTARVEINNAGYEPAKLSEYDTEGYLSRNYLQRLTGDELYKKLQIEYEDSIKSIQKYGGFYIGRYETGDLTKKIPVVKKVNTDICSQNWYEVYNKSGNMGANINVKTNVIWGSFWDETVQWFIDSGSKTYTQVSTSSTAFGNFNDSTFSYITTSGSTTTKSKGSSIRIPTGSAEYTKINNIYDMAGNVWECVLEARPTTLRASRSGDFTYPGTSIPLGSRSYGVPEFKAEISGARAYMYIR